MVVCLGQGADLHMVQLMPLPLAISCSSKSRLVLSSWFYFSGAGSPRYPQTKSKWAVKRLCVCAQYFYVNEHRTAVAAANSNANPFNGFFSRTSWVSQHQKGITILDDNKETDDGVVLWTSRQVVYL